MSQKVRNIVMVSSSTLASRVLGVIRDSIVFSFFGTSALSSAFYLAFTFPNLFRRLLGEGALTSALIPVFSHTLENKPLQKAFDFFNKVITRVGFILVMLVGVGIGLMLYVPQYEGLPDRWYLAAELSALLMPYMLFICLAAVIAAALNVMQSFALASFSAVWLNVAMILSLGYFSKILQASPRGAIDILCYGVLIGGVLQLFFPAWQLWKKGWRFRLDSKGSTELDETVKLFLPAVLGAAIFQVNLVVSRFLAFGLNTSAVSILYLANRLVELPQGVFSLAVATVIFPELSKFASKSDNASLTHVYQQGVRLILAITIPAAIGLILLAKPILELLFEWGKFEANDVAQTIPVLMTYSLAIPLYSLATIATRGFHACRDTKTPVKIAAIAFISNLGFSLLLMWKFSTLGLALASFLSILIQCICLACTLSHKNKAFHYQAMLKPLGKVLVASLVMGLIVAGGIFLLEWQLGKSNTKLLALLEVTMLIPAGIGVYLILLWAMQFEEMQLIKRLLGQKKVFSKS